MIKAHDLGKTVATSEGQLTILKGIDLEIKKSESVAIVGASGSGKTTLLSLLAGLDTPSRGQIFLGDHEITSLDEEERALVRSELVGFVFQSFQLLASLTAVENVMLPAELKGDSDALQKSMALLERVGLQHRVNHYPKQLSGGEQQRVALARALAPRPRVMLMDEPFSGLDNRLRDGIRDETLDLLKAEETAVLLVTHEPEEAMRMADEIALMRDGRIVQVGAPYNVYTRPVDRAAVSFFSDTNLLKAQVRGALAQTPFGQFLSPGIPDGTDVDIVFRPQHVRIDFDRDGRGPLPTPTEGVAARGVVHRSRFLGHESLVEFRMDFGNEIIKATVPNVFLPKPGKVMWLTVRRDRCFVFPA